MGISSSLNAGVSGLNANANKLATISDNIANSQTNGYKRADVDFSSLAVSDNSAPNTIGGGRWFTAGGVRTGAIWDIEQKGALATTSNSTDIAIAGRGMLPVTSIASVDETGQGLPFMLTSTGSFDTDADGYLRTSSGLVLLGWAANPDGTIPAYPRDSSQGLRPVQVNLSGAAAEPTTSIDLNVTLPATATQLTGTGSGTVQTVTTEYFDNLGASKTLSFGFTPTVAASGSAGTNTWTLDIVDQATGASGGSYGIVFDDSSTNAGNVLSVTQLSGGTAPVTSAYDAGTGDLTLDFGNQTIAVGLGSDSGGASHMTQLGSNFLQTGLTKDGSGAGTFSGLSVDENGILHASYSTGFTKALYQIPVADVPNPDGLTVLDNQTFSISRASGSLYLWNAGQGPTGEMRGYSLEQSTTDIADELTHLIQTQRAYSSNAKIIQTVDEMLQETTNLKR
ncbi:flagellar hook protein FlgE [Amaricoccus macauensis]|uniref:Flagellar hook protein FlgE n=1 Tax=Amaricoccus macauensis TaxID=57001 RepID=A0A840SLY0_9RHOB|nr:flagellar hook-basal body complex protein [Amaricoccus macauensis]MBB5220876.1 flagellar hook protein FlgE [Amaricoccus macauensis]